MNCRCARSAGRGQLACRREPPTSERPRPRRTGRPNVSTELRRGSCGPRARTTSTCERAARAVVAHGPRVHRSRIDRSVCWRDGERTLFGRAALEGVDMYIVGRRRRINQATGSSCGRCRGRGWIASQRNPRGPDLRVDVGLLGGGSCRVLDCPGRSSGRRRRDRRQAVRRRRFRPVGRGQRRALRRSDVGCDLAGRARCPDRTAQGVRASDPSGSRQRQHQRSHGTRRRDRRVGGTRLRHPGHGGDPGCRRLRRGRLDFHC